MPVRAHVPVPNGRRTLSALTFLVLVTMLAAASAGTRRTEDGRALLQEGTSAVRAGDYKGAERTLERAVGLLSGERRPARLLCEAFFYLGIARLGTGSEAPAAAAFQSAVAADGSFRPSASDFSSEVVSLYEAAWESAIHRTATEPKGKTVSLGPTLLIGGALGAASVAVIASRSEEDDRGPRRGAPPQVAVPSVSVAGVPNPAFISPAQRRNVSWVFVETGGVGITIVSRTGFFTTVLGQRVGVNAGPFGNNVFVPGGGTATWIDQVYLPADVAAAAYPTGAVDLHQSFTYLSARGESGITSTILRITF